MKIDIFVPTGEVRKAMGGEWCKTQREEWETTSFGTEGEYPIGIRHQIEVPEKADRIIYYFQNDKELSQFGWEAITLPRPKKVKKWWWNYEDSNDIDDFATEGYLTEDEIKKQHPNAAWYHKIDETEIEVSDD